jgi:hypothetical protein
MNNQLTKCYYALLSVTLYNIKRYIFTILPTTISFSVRSLNRAITGLCREGCNCIFHLLFTVCFLFSSRQIQGTRITRAFCTRKEAFSVHISCTLRGKPVYLWLTDDQCKYLILFLFCKRLMENHFW